MIKILGEISEWFRDRRELRARMGRSSGTPTRRSEGALWTLSVPPLLRPPPTGETRGTRGTGKTGGTRPSKSIASADVFLCCPEGRGWCTRAAFLRKQHKSSEKGMPANPKKKDLWVFIGNLIHFWWKSRNWTEAHMPPRPRADSPFPLFINIARRFPSSWEPR